MTPPVETIVRRKLSDEVFARLRGMITSGDLNPGDEMPSERELMERFGVGRPAIREAMQALANMGLVAISHGERARVLELSARSILRQVDTTAQMMLAKSSDALEHLKSARILLECGIAREAATRATEADIADLRANQVRQRAALGDPDSFIAADMEFHSRIAHMSANPIYVAVNEAMQAWLRGYYKPLLIWTGKEQQTLWEHQTIIDCLSTRDADQTEGAMRIHLERSRERQASKDA